jgi:4-hydroxy-tetrahydrodipicolinate reductase
MATPIIVCGAAGRMGRVLVQLVHQHPDARLHAAIEATSNATIGSDAGTLAGVGPINVTITDDYAGALTAETITLDFTTPEATLEHLRAAVAAQAGIVIGTTGYNQVERRELDELAPRTRSVVAANMSVGVNVLLKLVAAAARMLGDEFDPEIIEMHHRLKVDAPSGTALALGRAISDSLGRDLSSDVRSGRQGIVGKRTAKEIGIMALRGGDVIGDHTVVFAGIGERIELTHRAQSRDSLARGALRAGLWLAHQNSGRYSMADVLGLG